MMTIYVYFVRRKTETMTHFTKCKSYENFPKENDCTQVLQNNTDDQFQIAETIRKRLQLRKKKIKNYAAGHPDDWTDPRAPGDCQAV